LEEEEPLGSRSEIQVGINRIGIVFDRHHSLPNYAFSRQSPYTHYTSMTNILTNFSIPLLGGQCWQGLPSVTAPILPKVIHRAPCDASRRFRGAATLCKTY